MNKKDNISQSSSPLPPILISHPRLMVDGYGIHAGQCVTALFPDGGHDITLWSDLGPAC